MKRKTMALWLALVICLSLLTGCGARDKAADEKLPESETPASSAVQQPVESEQPAESTTAQTPTQDESEEPAQPTQEQPQEENNAGTALLALLQEEYQNGFVEGEGLRHNYFNWCSGNKQAFLDNGVVYIYGAKVYNDDRYSFCSYDIATKELRESVSPHTDTYRDPTLCFLDGNFYFMGYQFEDSSLSMESRVYDGNGALLRSFDNLNTSYYFYFFEKGILAHSSVDGSVILLSHDLEKIADIPDPQREVEHGLTEDATIGTMFAADGTIYARDYDSQLYRFNMDTYAWEDAGISDLTEQVGSFCGKYVTRKDGIYDNLTGEQVFEYGELYPAVSEWGHNSLCYFGGDKYLGFKDKEYRWVNLKDMSMSDPLPFPDDVYKGDIVILNDTYCAYKDQYGWFLLDYNTGEEETIYLFEQ